MATESLYRLEFRPLSRSQGGGGPVAKSAYRAGTKLDDGTGKTYDYSRKGRLAVRGSEMLLPQNAPSWAHDPGEYWRRVDAAERRVDARWGREVLITLPRELSPTAQAAVIHQFARDQLMSRGMTGQISIHDYGDAVGTTKSPSEHAALRAEITAGLPSYTRAEIDAMRRARDPRAWQDHAAIERGGALRRYQPHVHIMVADRPLTDIGFASKKDRRWNDKSVVIEMRQTWERVCNEALAQAGSEARIDCRSRQDRGDNMIPPEPKVGHAASAGRRAEYAEARAARRMVRERRQIDRALAAMAPTACGPDGTPREWAPQWAMQATGLTAAQWGRWQDEGEQRHLLIGLSGGGRVADHGDRLTMAGTDMSAQAEAMAALAKAKGWQNVNLFGSPEAQIAMARAHARQGIPLADADPAAKTAWEQERQRLKQEIEAETRKAGAEARQHGYGDSPPQTPRPGGAASVQALAEIKRMAQAARDAQRAPRRPGRQQPQQGQQEQRQQRGPEPTPPTPSPGR